jgi:hypothetical protein
LGNQGFGKLKIEIAEGEDALRVRGRQRHGA